MNKIIIIILALIITGCSGVKRNKFTDPTFRIMIDSDSIGAANYVRIQQALVKSNKYIVVDRSAGFRAIKKEQEMLHRKESDRFLDKEKYAIWGKLYGVGGVVVASSQCYKEFPLIGSPYFKCQLNLALINSRTARVIGVADDQQDTESSHFSVAADWSNAVKKLNESIPEYFERDQKHEQLTQFELEAEQEALKQKRELTNQEIDQERKGE